jgi:sugar phosphate isomerase/epimerase
MIYVSSACVKTRRVGDAVRQLADAGFSYIELSGGTTLYSGWKTDLLKLKEEYSLHYLLHNYFPPPEKSFVLNLASLDNAIYDRTIRFYEESIFYARELGGDGFGFHAGFYFDPDPEGIGRPFKLVPLYKKQDCVERFCSGFEQLQQQAEDIHLYIENHVLSKENAETFKPENPLMLCTADDFHELNKVISFPILLDLGHIYITSNTLRLDYIQQVNELLRETDYIHLSANDGEKDSNNPFNLKNPILAPLRGKDISDYTITLEIYDGLNAVRKSFESVRSLLTMS